MEPTAEPAKRQRRCVFCRMHAVTPFLRIPMCGICRDQAYDFLWASGVQGSLAAVGLISATTLLLEEVLLFAVLVIVKHRLQQPWATHGGHS